MFCMNCGYQYASKEAKFCTQCGTGLASLSANNPQSAATVAEPSSLFSMSDSKPQAVKSFIEYKSSKGSQWKSSVSKKSKNCVQPEKQQDVGISIALMEWSEKEMTLKVKRGKRLVVRVSNEANYSTLRKKAEEKWKAYHSNHYQEGKEYLLLFEDGKEAVFLPGSKEFFSLKRYHQELGKDYKRVTLFLCTATDHNMFVDEHAHDDDGDDGGNGLPRKYGKFDIEEDHKEVDILQIEHDEQLAVELQNQFDKEGSHVPNPVAQTNISNNQESKGTEKLITEQFLDHFSVVNALKKRVNDSEGQFFIVTRRGSSFMRCLTLWGRESKRNMAEKTLRVHYSGEDGIDSGAMGKEFLAKAMLDMGNVMFPGGTPVDSTYHVQNGNFRVCGEIVAVSLAQGGPPPCFLEECVYDALVNPDVDIQCLNPEKHVTPDEKKLLDRVRNDLSNSHDIIIDYGYTGTIDQDHVDGIIRSIVVSLVNKRLLYLSEFMKGLELYGLAGVIKQNPDSCKPLFVNAVESVDANYVFSLVKPQFSPEGSTRKMIEESVIDNLQDFLMSLEDEKNVTGYTEAIAWNHDEENENGGSKRSPTDRETDEQFQTADVTVPGVLGWLTGQRHKPIDGAPLTITVEFDHDCLSRNPKHTICFPSVRACGRELTLPVCHMTDSEQFRKVFLLAYCKGQAFSRP